MLQNCLARGQGHSSVVQWLLSRHEALGLSPTTAKHTKIAWWVTSSFFTSFFLPSGPLCLDSIGSLFCHSFCQKLMVYYRNWLGLYVCEVNYEISVRDPGVVLYMQNGSTRHVSIGPYEPGIHSTLNRVIKALAASGHLKLIWPVWPCWRFILGWDTSQLRVPLPSLQTSQN